jgi:hypothetical protein
MTCIHAPCMHNPPTEEERYETRRRIFAQPLTELAQQRLGHSASVEVVRTPTGPEIRVSYDGRTESRILTKEDIGHIQNVFALSEQAVVQMCAYLASGNSDAQP